MRIQQQLNDLDPAAYAPYRNPREYITCWTDRIWINRGLGQIHAMYAPDVKVHTCYGETYGMRDVIGNSMQKMVAFPNRGGGHDDVIWEARGRNSFISSHRVFNNATHTGHWTYGPPTGKTWFNRGVAHCLVRDNVVVEEWVVRDEFAVLECLGIDPYRVAAELAECSPVLGTAIENGAQATSFGGVIGNAVQAGVSGARPARYEAECELIMRYFEQVWNQRHIDRVAEFCDTAVVCQSVRMRRVMQISNFQMEVMALLAPFPDGVLEVRDIAVHESSDLGLRIAVVWLLRATYSGSPVYGTVNRAPVNILGISHFELRDGKISREYRIFDEISVIAQIIKYGHGWTAPLAG